MKHYFPFLDWMSNYKRADLGGDLSAGITVGVMLIPQGMAYAMLAGLPPIYGLYAATIPLFIYAFLGKTPQLAIGPVAVISLLVSRGVGSLSTSGTEEFIMLAILLALLAGIIQFAMGVFRLGFLVNFLSHPVVAGFISAAGIIIGFSQVKHLLGLDIQKKRIYQIVLDVFENFRDINPETFIIGFSSILILVGIKRINKVYKIRIPGPLIVVLFGLMSVYFLKLYDKGVSIIRDIPEGLPVFSLPQMDYSDIKSLLPIAFTIAFISFIESMAIAKALQRKHKKNEIKPNQELMAMGLSNIFGSLFKAFPVTGGFSRTAVNNQSGARTGLASMISGTIVVLTLLFLTNYFYYLPNAVLAAIIMVAVVGLIDIKEAKHLWQTDRVDFVLFCLTAIGTMVLGVEPGIIIGILLSIIMVIYRISNPEIEELGQIPGKHIFRNIQRFPELEIHNEILILRIDSQIYFANSNFIKESVYKKIKQKAKLRHLIFDAGAINRIDSSGFHFLKDMIEDLHQKGIVTHFVQVRGGIRDVMKKHQMFDENKRCQFWLTVEDAVIFIKRAQKDITKRPYIFQSN